MEYFPVERAVKSGFSKLGQPFREISRSTNSIRCHHRGRDRVSAKGNGSAVAVLSRFPLHA